jgi:sugar-specific transcriptional regulator TrmB
MQVLARRANIDRGTAYHVAKTLGEKSLFAQVTDGVRPLFRATPPREFHQRLERQHIELERQLIALQTVLVDLEELYAIGDLSKEAL